MRTIAEYFIRKRNRAFTWPASLPVSVLASFIWQQSWNVLRGLQTNLRLRKSRMMLRSRNVTILALSSFRWGSYLKLGEHVHINAAGKNGLHIGNNVSLGAYSRVIVSGSIMNPGAGIKIGNNVGIGEFAYLGGGGGLEIGDDCIAGQYLSCHPENHVTDDIHIPVRLQGVTRKGIKIGRNCWFGSKVTVLDGVTLGKNCVIAAGAVVTRSFPDNSVIGGVPARILKNEHKQTLTLTY